MTPSENIPHSSENAAPPLAYFRPKRVPIWPLLAIVALIGVSFILVSLLWFDSTTEWGYNGRKIICSGYLNYFTVDDMRSISRTTKLNPRALILTIALTAAIVAAAVPTIRYLWRKFTRLT